MKQFTTHIVTYMFLLDVLLRTNGDVIVNTNVGKIRGYNASDGDYTMFMGIPYAVVNTSNPFGAAISFPTLEGVFEANDDSAMCPQKEEYNNTIVGSLDCLRVNIYVPNANTGREKFAVIFYIYGGGFVYGYAKKNLYGPKYFMKQNVIFVTINYRVGPFGFMCLNIPQAPGNQGLKDQTLGMKWVKNNIEAFGGDPNRITIVGHSSGGVCVDLHLLSEQGKFYNKAIVQSSSSFCPIFKESNKENLFLFTKYFGRTFKNTNEAISFLATVDPLKLIQASYDLSLMDTFGPCVETKIDGVNHFLTESWLTKKDLPKVENMNIMIGFTNDELGYTYDTGRFKVSEVIKDRLAWGFDINHKDFKGMPEMVQLFYMQDEEIDARTRRQISNFDSDFTFVNPLHRSLRRYIKNSVSSVYLYEFAYMGMRNYNRYKSHTLNTSGGALHADELGYLFDIDFLPTPSKKDQLIIDMMTTMWANFAKYGDPTPQTTTLLPVKWLPITNGSQYYYFVIDSELSLGSRPYHDRMEFWDLFYKANYHVQRLYHTGTAGEE